MATGDGLLVRIRPRGGVLTARAARLLAEAAVSYGNGAIELTSRASLQIRGLAPASTARFAEAMVAAGLAHADAAAERRRNVIATPLADVDPAAHPQAAAVTAALEAALEADETLGGLPAKFGFVVDGGGLVPASAEADVSLHLFADHAEIAGDAVLSVPLSEAVGAALAAARRGERRMRQWTALNPEAAPVGALAYRQDAHAFGAGLPFGSTDVATLRMLADLAEEYGDRKLRLTAWRTVLIAGVIPGRVPALRRALGELGLIVDKSDPRARVAACPGLPACGSATVTTRALAARLRPAPGTTVHVSGCDKGCAHPGPATVTLVGRGGFFDVVREGRAGDQPAQTGLTFEQALAQ